MQTGKIQTFFPDRGFGFIRPDKRGQPDVFFHTGAMQFGTVPEEGCRVEFEIGKDGRHEKAHAVSVRPMLDSKISISH